METIIDKKYGRTDRFEPVTEVPFGYSVWNIGRHNFPHEKCVPLCKLGKNVYKFLKEAGRKGVDRDRFYEIVNSKN